MTMMGQGTTMLLGALLLTLGALPTALAEGGDTVLDGETIESMVLGNTAACRKQKDQSTCSIYFADDGVMIRQMHDSGVRKQGRWFTDDSDRLCILWDGRYRPSCFVLHEREDGVIDLIKGERHLSSILEMKEGNADKL